MAEKVLFWYDLTSLKASHKVRFVYVLKGRKGEKGLIEKFGGEFLVNGCFILPIENEKEMKEVFRFWKVKFKFKGIIIK
ncbi:MAG: hypothetical protein KAT77_02185 [Nanoarchaeota archaeon]|nr:hypothetical protein [Nanoarchaeota archaeon]